MERLLRVLLLLLVSSVCLSFGQSYNSTCAPTTGTIGEFTATDLDGVNVTLSDYQGDVLLVVNIATFWGYTTGDFLGLNDLISKYGSQGFNVLTFGCSQFANLNPQNDNETLLILEYVRPGNGYKPNFPVFANLLVNGADQHPLYAWLKGACPPTNPWIGSLPYISWSPIMTTDITWNYEKFLIDRNGQPVMRFNPGTSPTDPGLVKVLETLLG